MQQKKISLNLWYPEFIRPAIYDESHFVIVPAGRQTGKTWNFVQWICEETLDLQCPSLWVDTVHTNIDKYIERYFKPILDPIWKYCDWHQQKKILRLPGKGFIDFGSAQKPENLEGFNYKRAVLNEAGHILSKSSLWDNTLMPMVKADDNRTRIIGTPKGKNKFSKLYDLGLSGNPEYKSYKYTVYDSPFWTEQQINNIRATTIDTVWGQEYMADFTQFKGMIYPDFNEAKHTKVSPRELTDIFFIGLDVGWNHPTAGLLIKEDKDRNIFVIDEFRESNMTSKDITNALRGMLARNDLDSDKIEMYVIDPASRATQQTSGQSMMEQLQEEGWGFMPGINDVMAGINRITRLLREDKLFVSKRCSMLREELLDYHWKEWKEGTDQSRNRPYKVGDDLVDALRYLGMSRPDWYEHPQLDMYGRVLQEGADVVTGYVKPALGTFDQMEADIDVLVNVDEIDNLM